MTESESPTPRPGEPQAPRATSPTPPAGRASTGAGMTMEKHLTLAGALHLGVSAIMLSVGLFVFVIIVGGGIASGEPEAMAITWLVGIAAGTFLCLLALPGLAAGWGLIQRKRWARIFGLVVGALNLVNVPLGTAIGVYTIWLLMQDEAIAILEGHAPASGA